jgi:hypothetical protein
MTMYTLKRMTLVLAAAGASLAFVGCGGASPEVRSDDSQLMATRPAGLDVKPDRSGRVAAPARAQARVPERVLRSPTERMERMEHLRRQIINKTRRIPDDKYAQVVRPDLRRQLLAMGLDERDADVILADVDHAR